MHPPSGPWRGCIIKKNITQKLHNLDVGFEPFFTQLRSVFYLIFGIIGNIDMIGYIFTIGPRTV